MPRVLALASTCRRTAVAVLFASLPAVAAAVDPAEGPDEAAVATAVKALKVGEGETIVFVTDLHCANCAKKVTSRLFKLKGVMRVRTSVKLDAAVITPQKKKTIDVEAAWTTLQEAGYQPTRHGRTRGRVHCARGGSHPGEDRRSADAAKKLTQGRRGLAFYDSAPVAVRTRAGPPARPRSNPPAASRPGRTAPAAGNSRGRRAAAASCSSRPASTQNRPLRGPAPRDRSPAAPTSLSRSDSPCGRHKREHVDRRIDAPRPHARHASAGRLAVRQCAGNRRRRRAVDQNRHADGLGEILQPRGEIDHRPEHAHLDLLLRPDPPRDGVAVANADADAKAVQRM